MNRKIIDVAIELYASKVSRNDRGEPILNDNVRQEVVEYLHANHPTWGRHMTMDDVERAVWKKGQT